MSQIEINIEQMQESDCITVSQIHIEELHDSLLTPLGKVFLSKFYYKALLNELQVIGFVAKSENKTIGFIIGITNSSPNFFLKLAYKNIVNLVKVLIKSIFQNPEFVKNGCNAIRLLLIRRKCLPNINSETLEFAISSCFLLQLLRNNNFLYKRNETKTSRCYCKNSIRISDILFDKIMKAFKEKGVIEYKAIVFSKNVMGNRFYLKRGAQLVSTQEIPGGIENVYINKVL